ncbi:MAG: lysine--tRNA ligase [Patescibacteria group bacterium]|nr:lysine--tRNA ligase [Patescibacteria group bacterium]
MYITSVFYFMLEDLIKDRERKLNKYQSFFDPYPADSKRDLALKEAKDFFAKLKRSKKPIFLIGRIRAWRDQGKIIFVDTEDESGRFQLVLDQKHLDQFDLVKETFDIGDFVEVCGSMYETKRGELSLLATKIRLLAKSLRPTPQSWYGLEDIETRLRKRYLDLLTNREVRDLFIKKSIFWDTIRNFLKKAGFLEVETPVFELVPGGADAEPFVTHHNALDQDFYLRISLELPLKKLLVGGFEKVFEIGRIFRNEGIDREHLQDYTQMECYWAYANHEDMMEFAEKMYKTAIKKTFGKFNLSIQGNSIDWGKKWPKIDYHAIFKKETGIDLNIVKTEELGEKAKKLGLSPESGFGRGRLIDLIYKKLVRPNFKNPCFLVGHPIEISPLAKADPKNPKKVLRFQILAGGSELGNGWAEVNNPIDQRKRFEEQMKLREQGDKEAQRLDEDFLEALEYGMPPAAGFGMSERLFAVLTDKPIRETSLYPLMKKFDK